MFSAKSIKNFRYLMVFSLFPMAAAVLTRWNYNFAGLNAMPTYDPYTPIIRISSYTPTWPEFAVATLVVSYWLLAFSVAARYLPFKSPEATH